MYRCCSLMHAQSNYVTGVNQSDGLSGQAQLVADPDKWSWYFDTSLSMYYWWSDSVLSLYLCHQWTNVVKHKVTRINCPEELIMRRGHGLWPQIMYSFMHNGCLWQYTLSSPNAAYFAGKSRIAAVVIGLFLWCMVFSIVCWSVYLFLLLMQWRYEMISLNFGQCTCFAIESVQCIIISLCLRFL